MTKNDSVSDGEPRVTPQAVAVVSLEDDPARDRARNFARILWGAAAVMLAITIFWVVFLLTTKYTDQSDQVNDLAHANVVLQEQNVELQKSIDHLTETQDIERATDECFDAYTARITDAAARFNTDGSGRILTMIVERLTGDPTTPPELRTPTVADLQAATQDAQKYRNNYATAIADRQAWVDRDKPVPCPIGPVHQGGIFDGPPVTSD